MKSYKAFYLSSFKSTTIPVEVHDLVKSLTNLDEIDIIRGDTNEHKGQSGVYLVFYLEELVSQY